MPARTERAQLEGPKKTTGGNARPDREWLEEVTAAGEIHKPDESTRPPGFLYDVWHQWDGTAEELNLDFFESFRRPASQRKPCNGASYVRDQRGGYVVDIDWVRLKRPCLKWVMNGSNVCDRHGGKIPIVMAAARQRLAEASEIVALRLIGLTAQADEKEHEIAHKDRIAAANSVLDRAGIKGGVEIEVNSPGYKKVLESMFGEDEPDAD